MALDPNKWTLKTQEAFSAAVEQAKSLNNPEVTADHLLAALLRQTDGGIALPILEKVGVDHRAVRNAADEAVAKLSKAYGGSDPRLSRELSTVMSTAEAAKTELGDEYLSVEHLLLGLTEKLERLQGRPAPRHAGGARLAPGHQPEPRGPVPGAREVRPGPHRRGPGRQARPGHRPRRGDPPGHPGPVPAHEEQPGAHRRTGRRQDRDRRGPRPSRRGGRRARDAEGQEGRQPRRVGHGRRAPSTAASSRSA